ncbi:MAG: hypothetical protein WDO18_08255 [Acidobacteriota bacterium]
MNAADHQRMIRPRPAKILSPHALEIRRLANQDGFEHRSGVRIVRVQDLDPIQRRRAQREDPASPGSATFAGQ